MKIEKIVLLTFLLFAVIMGGESTKKQELEEAIGCIPILKKAERLSLLGNREQGTLNRKKVFLQIWDAPEAILIISETSPQQNQNLPEEDDLPPSA
jgi:hypothetical protein